MFYDDVSNSIVTPTSKPQLIPCCVSTYRYKQANGQHANTRNYVVGQSDAIFQTVSVGERHPVAALSQLRRGLPASDRRPTFRIKDPGSASWGPKRRDTLHTRVLH